MGDMDDIKEATNMDDNMEDAVGDMSRIIHELVEHGGESESVDINKTADMVVNGPAIDECTNVDKCNDEDNIINITSSDDIKISDVEQAESDMNNVKETDLDETVFVTPEPLQSEDADIFSTPGDDPYNKTGTDEAFKSQQSDKSGPHP